MKSNRASALVLKKKKTGAKFQAKLFKAGKKVGSVLERQSSLFAIRFIWGRIER